MLKILMVLALSSSAFQPNGEIPREYTCQGAHRSVPLSWNKLPPKTKSLALIVDDPDAPDPAAPQLTWVHWVAYNIPSHVTVLKAGLKPGDMSKGALTGCYDWKRAGRSCLLL